MSDRTVRRTTLTVAREVGVHPQTLRRWERERLLTVRRDWRGARIYSAADVARARELAGLEPADGGR